MKSLFPNGPVVAVWTVIKKPEAWVGIRGQRYVELEPP